MDKFQIRQKMKRLKKWARGYNKKIDELEKAKAHVRTNALHSSYTFCEALQAKGFELLGSGAFSTVYGYPGKDRVIKVTHRPHTDGWLDYTHWAAQKGYAGRFAPQIYSYKLIKSKSPTKPGSLWEYATDPNGFGVAVMERLDLEMNKVAPDHDANTINVLFSQAMRDNKLAHKFLATVDPEFPKFAVELMTEYKGHLDIHGGNIMLRKDGSFVVTDPVCGLTSKVASRRLKAGDFTSPVLAA